MTFYHKLKRWITPKLCSSGIKDCSIWWGNWSPTVFWRTKCSFKSPLKHCGTLPLHNSVLFSDPRNSEVLFWHDQLFKRWLKQILSLITLVWNLFNSFPLLLKLSLNSSIYYRELCELASAYLHSFMAGQFSTLFRFQLHLCWPSLHIWNRPSSLSLLGLHTCYSHALWNHMQAKCIVGYTSQICLSVSPDVHTKTKSPNSAFLRTYPPVIKWHKLPSLTWNALSFGTGTLLLNSWSSFRFQFICQFFQKPLVLFRPHPLLI